jgi:hypothetical protein
MPPKDDVVLYVMEEPASFAWPVKVPVPVDGKYVRGEFTAVFANLQGDALDELTATEADAKQKFTDLEIANRVLLGWGDDLKGGNGKPLEFNDVNKARLLANIRVRMAVVGTFLAATRGVAAEKN